MYKLSGSGLPNIYLCDGYDVSVDEDGDEVVSYMDLDGLYAAIGKAIALKAARLTGAEVRFLRKRLNWSQAQLGALGDKSSQAAAKWEKGELPVPVAEANLLRLCWLRQNSPHDLGRAVGQIPGGTFEQEEQPLLAFAFVDGAWRQNLARARVFAVQSATASTSNAILRAMDIQESSTSSTWMPSIGIDMGQNTHEAMT